MFELQFIHLFVIHSFVIEVVIMPPNSHLRIVLVVSLCCSQNYVSNGDKRYQTMTVMYLCELRDKGHSHTLADLVH